MHIKKWAVTAVLQKQYHNTRQLKDCLPHQCAYVKRKILNNKTPSNTSILPHLKFSDFLNLLIVMASILWQILTVLIYKVKSFHMALLYSERRICFMTKGTERLKLFTYVSTEKKHWKILMVYLHCFNKIYFKDYLKLISIIILFWITPINWCIEEFFQLFWHTLYTLYIQAHLTVSIKLDGHLKEHLLTFLEVT